MSGQLYAQAALPAGSHCVEFWVDLRAGLDAGQERKFLTLSGLELRLHVAFLSCEQCSAVVLTVMGISDVKTK
jgi:hypothetical protein